MNNTRMKNNISKPIQTYIKNILDYIFFYLLGVKHQRKYKCSYSHCPWNNYKNNTDWGLYNNIHGNCSACRERCSEDLACKGIECGVFVKNAYCSWWGGMSCSQMEEKTINSENIITCMKILAGNWMCI